MSTVKIIPVFNQPIRSYGALPVHPLTSDSPLTPTAKLRP